MIEKIKNHIIKDEQVKKGMENEEKTDELLERYIVSKAREYLDSVNGGIEDEIVYGWAKHFYIEPLEELEKEMEDLRYVPVKQTQEPKKTVVKQEPKKEDNQLSLFDL